MELEINNQKERINLLQRENGIQTNEIKGLKNKLSLLSKLKHQIEDTNQISLTQVSTSALSEQAMSVSAMLNILTTSFRQLKSSFQSSFTIIEDNLLQMKKAQRQIGEAQVEEIKKQFKDLTSSISKSNQALQSSIEFSSLVPVLFITWQIYI